MCLSYHSWYLNTDRSEFVGHCRCQRYAGHWLLEYIKTKLIMNSISAITKTAMSTDITVGAYDIITSTFSGFHHINIVPLNHQRQEFIFITFPKNF